MATYLPQPKEIRDLLGDLLGREVTLSPSVPFAPGPSQPGSVGVYVDDSLRIVAVVACDLGFSAYAGAAIGLVPVGAAQDAVEAGALSENLTENLYEVLNISASLFNAPGADHVRLYELHPAGGDLPPAVRMQTLTLGRREDLDIAIAGYGAGRLSVVLVA